MSMKQSTFSCYVLRSICIKYDFFNCGSVTQYEKLFKANEDGATLEQLALIIWVCSRQEYNQILKALHYEYQEHIY